MQNNLIFFWFPKFLELFFTPKNTPTKAKNSKMGLNHIFLGHPVDLLYYLFCNLSSCHTLPFFRKITSVSQFWLVWLQTKSFTPLKPSLHQIRVTVLLCHAANIPLLYKGWLKSFSYHSHLIHDSNFNNTSFGYISSHLWQW